MESTKVFISIIYSIIPDFNISLISVPLKNTEIDSIDLVTIRVEFEKILGKNISDNDWLNFNSLQDIIDYCTIPNTNKLSVQNSQSDFDATKNIIINMPQMAVGALSENWLFKELGDFHWHLLCNGLNTKSFNLKDELGNRLYATFVRIRIKFSVALDEFEENEEVSINGKIKRFGNGMYFSEILLQSQKGITEANLMTSFSIRDEVDNTKLMKSQPYGGLNTIEEYTSFPEFGDEYRLIKKNIKKELKSSDNFFSITDNILFESEYKLNPFYDLNGVGLLYFAAYPIINDVSESKYFTALHSGKRWEQDYYTIFRDIFYFANCNINDSIEYKLHSHEIISNNKIKITSSLYRKSDGIIIARLFTIKKKK